MRCILVSVSYVLVLFHFLSYIYRNVILLIEKLEKKKLRMEKIGVRLYFHLHIINDGCCCWSSWLHSCYVFNEKSCTASEEKQKSLGTRRLIYGELLLHDWAIQPRGSQRSGKLLSNDISEDDHRYWTNELYWAMGLRREGGQVWQARLTRLPRQDGPMRDENTIVFTL